MRNAVIPESFYQINFIISFSFKVSNCSYLKFIATPVNISNVIELFRQHLHNQINKVISEKNPNDFLLIPLNAAASKKFVHIG